MDPFSIAILLIAAIVCLVWWAQRKKETAQQLDYLGETVVWQEHVWIFDQTTVRRYEGTAYVCEGKLLVRTAPGKGQPPLRRFTPGNVTFQKIDTSGSPYIGVWADSVGMFSADEHRFLLEFHTFFGRDNDKLLRELQKQGFRIS